jgi:short-subunit dehydrogenase
MENSFVIITNASSGIGFELAKQFGKDGFELLICSHNEDIFEAQRKLEEFGYVVEAIEANLATYHGVENLYREIQNYGKTPYAIAINAGPGVSGNFSTTSLRDEINSINLNIISPIHLVKRILPYFKLHGEGRILFSSSLPADAVSGGSKAFITSFVDSVRNELKGSGVTMTTLNFENETEEVAKEAYEALMARKETVFSEGIKTKIQDYAFRIKKWSETSFTKYS